MCMLDTNYITQTNIHTKRSRAHFSQLKLEELAVGAQQGITIRGNHSCYLGASDTKYNTGALHWSAPIYYVAGVTDI